MVKETRSFHLDNSVFFRTMEIIQDEDDISIEDVVQVMDDLILFESETRKLLHLLIETTYNKIVDKLIDPIDELFESEYLIE